LVGLKRKKFKAEIIDSILEHVRPDQQSTHDLSLGLLSWPAAGNFPRRPLARDRPIPGRMIPRGNTP
jgi:hypothetical protein